jgi:hypothetical protein
MKSQFLLKLAGLLAVFLVASLWLGHYAQERHSLWKKLKNPETVRQLQRFVTFKKNQADTDTNGVPPEFRSMFKDAERGNWLALSNSFQELNGQIAYWASLGYGVRRSNDYWGMVEDVISDVTGKMGRRWEPRAPPPLEGTSGEAVKEVVGALEGFAVGDEGYSSRFGREIIDSIPAGSIYFGGYGPGRFLVTTMCRSQPGGDPFYLVTQNELSEKAYRKSVRDMYGKEIYVPTDDDDEICIKEFMEDGVRQMQSHTLGSGRSAFQEVNGMLAKMMFEENPHREFYADDNYPMEWMNPYLEPHGLIFKLNRQPVATISDEIISRDHAYWAQLIKPMIGDWLTESTSTTEIAAFIEKTYRRQDLNGFRGDLHFIQNAYSQRIFSESRLAIAALYRWHADHATDPADKKRMLEEADLAFRQAWALSPDSLQTVCGYVNFLLDQNQDEIALLVANTAKALPQNKDNDLMAQLTEQLKQWRHDHPSTTSK